MKISTSITLGFIVPLAIGTILIGVITTTSIINNSKEWNDISSSFMNSVENSTLENRTEDRSLLAKETFEQSSNTVENYDIRAREYWGVMGAMDNIFEAE